MNLHKWLAALFVLLAPSGCASMATDQVQAPVPSHSHEDGQDMRCWQSGSRFGLRCSDPARSDCSPGYMPILPVRMSCPSSCEWDGTGACTWSVAMEAHPEGASRTKSAASHLCRFIALKPSQ